MADRRWQSASLHGLGHRPEDRLALLQVHGAGPVVRELREVGAGRLHYCFDSAYEEPVRMVREMKMLTEEEKALILGENAKRLLKL